MTVMDELEKELVNVVKNGFYSVNFDEDNKTIKYLYLDGKFDGVELSLIGEIFNRYKGKDAYKVVK